MSAGDYSKQDKGPRDPWDDLEIEIESAISEVTLLAQQISSASANPPSSSPTSPSSIKGSGQVNVLVEDQFLEALKNVELLLEDIQMAHAQAVQNPDLYPIPTVEMQRRTEKVHQWNRAASKPIDEGKRLRAAQLRRLRGGNDAGSPGRTSMADIAQNQRNGENGDFIQQQMEDQRNITNEQDETVDRLRVGVRRVKDHAVNIRDELDTQERIMTDLEAGMTQVQVKLEGVIKKVSHILDNSSDRTKYIIIIILFIVLLLLVFMLFSN